MSLYIIVFILFISQGQSALQLDLSGPGLKGRDPVLVRGFVSFPPGTCREAAAHTLIDAGGRSCPADFKATARWSDGSVRYLSLKAVVEARRAGGRLKLFFKPSPRTEESFSGSFEVKSGSLGLKLSSNSEALIEAVLLDGEKLADARLEVQLNGERFHARPPRHVLLRGDSAEQVVQVAGSLQSRFSGAGPGYRLELFIPRESHRMHARLHVTAGEGFCEGMRFRLVPAEPHPLIRITAGDESVRHKGRVELSARGGALYVDQSGDVDQLSRGGSARFSAGRLTLGLPRFSSLHPWSVGFDPASGMALSLLSDAFECGEGFSCERVFSIEARQATRIRGLQTETAFRCAGFGRARDPRHRVFPFSTARDLGKDSLLPLYTEVSGRLIAALKREWKTWDGYRDHGDYRTWFGHYANLEFDPVYGLVKRFLLLGCLDDLSTAEIMVRHWRRFDLTGAHDEGFPPGVPWVHGTDHRTELIDSGHMWVDGVLLLYFLTGEEEYLDAALSIGRFLNVPEPRGRMPARCASWKLMALTALVEAGHEEFVPGMNGAAALICHRQTRAGYFRFDTGKVENTECLAANTWVTGGITVEALFRHFLITGDRRSHAAIVRAGRWLQEACRDPVSGIWYQRLHYSTEDEGLLLERSARVEQENLLFLALGFARVGQLTGDRSCLKRARSLAARGLEQLEEEIPALPGRALSVVLRTAPEVMAANGRRR